MRSPRTRTSTVVGLALTVLLVMQFVAGIGTAAQEKEKILRVAQGTYPAVLDPQKTGWVMDIAVLSTSYEGLTRLDANLDTVPAAAESWSFSEDGTILTFKLRAGLTYSDGSPLTAQRFAYSAVRACDPNTASLYASILFVVVGCQELNSLGSVEGVAPSAGDEAYVAAKAAVGITALDERTLEVRLKEPAPYFLAVAATWVFYPVKQEVIETGGEDWWKDPANHVGNGPFRITRLEEEQQISFAANERYWGGRPKIDGIDYVYIKEYSTVAFEAYKAGQVDIVGVDAAQLTAVKADPALSAQLLTYPIAATTALQFNLSKEPFTDKKVREAFAYAFDRETWCNVVLNGTCNSTVTWIPEGVPGHVPMDAYAFDPEQARQALAASSYGGAAKLPKVELVYVIDDPVAQARSEWIAGQYREILGVELTLVPVDSRTWGGMVGSVETFPDLTFFGWSQDYPDPQNWLSVYWSCDAWVSSIIGYCNPAFDELVGRADRELDPAKRLALYEEASRILIADVPAIIAFNPVATALIKPYVTGLTPTPSDPGFPGGWASLLTVDLTS